MKFIELEHIIEGKLLRLENTESDFSEIAYDTRKNISSDYLFFAFSSKSNDGHSYIKKAYQKGVRNFVISSEVILDPYPNSNFYLVSNTLNALQQLASHHRNQFELPVIGVTGSYGKTIIKEWLSILLQHHFQIVKSPKSFNSQIGVPLSLWQINKDHNLGIIEAGISNVNEMSNLEKMINPTYGIFTNIGSAHDLGFKSMPEKIKEKLKLFENCKSFIYCADHAEVHHIIQTDDQLKSKAIGWSVNGIGQINFSITKNIQSTNVSWRKNRIVTLPFSDLSSIENALHCLTMIELLEHDPSSLQDLFSQLSALPLRLELKQGKENAIIINDTYIADFNSLKIALEFQDEQNLVLKKVAILSAFDPSKESEATFDEQLLDLLQRHKIHHLIGVGSRFCRPELPYHSLPKFSAFQSVESLIRSLPTIDLSNQNILVKGSRKSKLDMIIPFIEEKTHQAILEIDLNQLLSNFKVYKQHLHSNTKMMAMIKALSYGSGTTEIAQALQRGGVDYLTAAYADEGVLLREKGITVPIMIMNPHTQSLGLLQQYNLEPEIFSVHMLKHVINHLESSPLTDTLKVHIKIDTGMNRLGFEIDELDEVNELIRDVDQIQVVSVFSHLSSADTHEEDPFTQSQFAQFDLAFDKLTKDWEKKPMKHILNSAGIIRFPDQQFDMVRLGIGLYGIDVSQSIQHELKLVSRLKTYIAQVKQVAENDSVGYNRSGKASQAMKIATVSLGYADGISRRFGNGNMQVTVKGIPCKTVGNICMDMFMIDVTEVEHVHENDEVIIFDSAERLLDMARTSNTIPYEILTSISARVKRIYIQD